MTQLEENFRNLIAVVVVWYNPSQLDDNLNALANILSYSNFIKTVYIIDNSKNNNEYLLHGIQNYIYIPNYCNLGIAKALNIGCNRALADNFTYVMTMDQDSYWKEEQLTNYISFTKKIIKSDSTIKSIAPNTDQPVVRSVLSLLKEKIQGKRYNPKKPPIKPTLQYPTTVICSGNIIDLSVWNHIGQFKEELFIDDVDNEYCYRLLSNGYKIIRNNSILLNHHLGSSKRTFFPKLFRHSGKRIYFIFRNELITHFYYPNYTQDTIPKLKIYAKDCILSLHCFMNIYYIINGYIDYKRIIKNDEFHFLSSSETK